MISSGNIDEAGAPLVSVIIPLFNQARFVSQAITSVLGQGVNRLEIIVVDDGSTDGSASVVEKFVSEYSGHIHLIRQRNSGGPAAPRNAAILRARGKYVAFLDPDDYWYPDKLSQQIDVLARFEDVVMVFADPDLVDESGLFLNSYLGRINYISRAAPHLRRISEHTYLSEPSFYAFSSAEIAGPVTSSVIVRRDVLLEEAVWFSTDLRVGEDLDLWFRIMQKHRVAFVNKPLSAYRQHGASLMQQTGIMLQGALACHERNFSRAQTSLSSIQKRQYARRIAGLSADIGYHAWLRGSNAAARSAYAKSWRWSRTSIHLMGWLKAWIPPRVLGALRSMLEKRGE